MKSKIIKGLSFRLYYDDKDGVVLPYYRGFYYPLPDFFDYNDICKIIKSPMIMNRYIVELKCLNSTCNEKKMVKHKHKIEMFEKAMLANLDSVNEMIEKEIASKKLNINNKKNKVIGSLLGGAVGDALGYQIEFLNRAQIKEKYGVAEIDNYYGQPLISDDTQMTLFTACGMLFAETRGKLRGILGPYYTYVADAYIDWYNTQNYSYKNHPESKVSWIGNNKDLYSRRAPGITCLESIRKYKENRKPGTLTNPINNSKGCGSVMRVAPVGLIFHNKLFEIDKTAEIGADVGAITHGHPLAYISSAFVASLCQYLVNWKFSLDIAILNVLGVIEELFYGNKHVIYFSKLIYKAIKLANSKIDSNTAIKMLGEGWVAEEAVAIAIYSSLRYSNDFEKAIKVSINHDGDSDSTGAITGNIMGAFLGLDKIPSHFTEKLELKDMTIELGNDLYDCYSVLNDTVSIENVDWIKKYCEI